MDFADLVTVNTDRIDIHFVNSANYLQEKHHTLFWDFFVHEDHRIKGYLLGSVLSTT